MMRIPAQQRPGLAGTAMAEQSTGTTVLAIALLPGMRGVIRFSFISQEEGASAVGCWTGRT